MEHAEERRKAQQLLQKLFKYEDAFRESLSNAGEMHDLIKQTLTVESDTQKYDKAVGKWEKITGVDAQVKDEVIEFLEGKRSTAQGIQDVLGKSKKGRRQTAEEYEQQQAALKIYNLLKTNKVKRIGYNGALLLWYLGYMDFPPIKTTRHEDSMVNLFLKWKDSASCMNNKGK